MSFDDISDLTAGVYFHFLYFIAVVLSLITVLRNTNTPTAGTYDTYIHTYISCSKQIQYYEYKNTLHSAVIFRRYRRTFSLRAVVRDTPIARIAGCASP